MKYCGSKAIRVHDIGRTDEAASPSASSVNLMYLEQVLWRVNCVPIFCDESFHIRRRNPTTPQTEMNMQH